jgi:transposase
MSAARIILAICAVRCDRVSIAEAARRAGLTRETVRDWVHRFEAASLAEQSAFLAHAGAVVDGSAARGARVPLPSLRDRRRAA